MSDDDGDGGKGLNLFFYFSFPPYPDRPAHRPPLVGDNVIRDIGCFLCIIAYLDRPTVLAARERA